MEEEPLIEVAEDSLSTIDGESNVGSSVSRLESDDESSSSSEDEEETEPKLKYERLSSDLKAILKKDVASCLAVHSKFLILGRPPGAPLVGSPEPQLLKPALPSATPHFLL